MVRAPLPGCPYNSEMLTIRRRGLQSKDLNRNHGHRDLVWSLFRGPGEQLCDQPQTTVMPVNLWSQLLMSYLSTGRKTFRLNSGKWIFRWLLWNKQLERVFVWTTILTKTLSSCLLLSEIALFLWLRTSFSHFKTKIFERGIILCAVVLHYLCLNANKA